MKIYNKLLLSYMSKLGERDDITSASELIKTNLKRPKVNAEPSGAYFLKKYHLVVKIN